MNKVRWFSSCAALATLLLQTSCLNRIDEKSYFGSELIISGTVTAPVGEGITGQPCFILKAFDGKDSSEVFNLADDPVAPPITSAAVAALRGMLDTPPAGSTVIDLGQTLFAPCSACGREGSR